MKTKFLGAAILAAATLGAVTPASAAEQHYSGKMPPMSERMNGKTPRDNVHMTLVGAEHYGRKPVTASVDEGKNKVGMIKVTYNP
jgi:hypothetical protein